MSTDVPRQPRDYFPNLTGLRGIAAGWVVLFHLWLLGGSPHMDVFGISLTPIFSCGFIGVDLFFVLSGFLLGLPFLDWAAGRRAAPNLVTFWKRRALRVLPAYYAQLIILIAAGWIASGHSPIDARALVAYLSMEFVFFAGVAPLLNGVWWSLPVEWNFYVVLPLIGWLFRRTHALVVVVAAFAFALAFRIWCEHLRVTTTTFGPIAYPAILQLPGRIDEFVFGMFAAWLHRRRTGTRGAMPMLLIGFAGIIVVLNFLGPRGDIFSQADKPAIFIYATFVGFVLAAIVCAAASPLPLAARLFGGRALAFLGTISYSLYLWHGIVFLIANHAGLPSAMHLPILALIVLPPAILVAWISYRLTEHPFLVTAPAARQDGAGAALP